jgi:hypothetical protein
MKRVFHSPNLAKDLSAHTRWQTVEVVEGRRAIFNSVAAPVHGDRLYQNGDREDKTRLFLANLAKADNCRLQSIPSVVWYCSKEDSI